jgi:hypothetical protein
MRRHPRDRQFRNALLVIPATAIGLILMVAAPVPCLAQGAVPAPPPEGPRAGSVASTQAPPARRWEIEGYGGFSGATSASSGTAALPPAGAPIPSLSPIFPSRATASWFFGDGAAMLNDVNAEFGVPARLTPLDAVLASPGLDYSNAVVLGVRLRRALTARFSAEVSFDMFPGSGDVSREFLDAVEETRLSFEDAFRGLFTSGPFASVDVATLFDRSSGSLGEIALTGALNWQLGSGSWVPYLTFGGGMISGAGDLSTIDLEGRYAFVPADAPELPFAETDRITIRVNRGTTFAGLAGAGLRHDLSERWGLRIDGRVFVGPQNSRLVIDAGPEVALHAPGDYLESLTNPNIQFSNDPATGRRSTLSAPPLDGFVAFEGTGVQTRFLVTVGVVVRF